MQVDKEILNYFRVLKETFSLNSSYIFIGRNFSIVNDVLKLIGCQEHSNFCNACWDCECLERGSHPDLFIVEPQGLSIKIDAVREGIRFLSLKSFRLKKKILLIKDATVLTPQAANAFLKTLEEAPKNSFIVLCSSKLEGLLPTIISRCQKIFLPPKEEKMDTSMVTSVREFLEGKDTEFRDRKKFSGFLWTFIELLHSYLLYEAILQDNQLLTNSGCEVVLKAKSVDQIQKVLRTTLDIYAVYNSVNINLALNLIKLKL